MQKAHELGHATLHSPVYQGRFSISMFLYVGFNITPVVHSTILVPIIAAKKESLPHSHWSQHLRLHGKRRTLSNYEWCPGSVPHRFKDMDKLYISFQGLLVACDILC